MYTLINMMEWPAFTADMSPIEHILDDLGRRVRNKSSTTSECRPAASDLCQSYINSNGGHARY